MALLGAAACGADEGGVPARPTTHATGAGGFDTSPAAGGLGGDGLPSGGGGHADAGVGGSGSSSGDGLPDGPVCDVEGTAGVCIDVASCVGAHTAVSGHCDGPSNVRCCIPIPASSCDPFDMAPPAEATLEAPGIGGCPPGMTRVETFCVDVYEAALVKVSDGTPWSPYFNPGVVPVRAVSVKGAIPQAYIDQVQAETACLEAGKRLCSDDEWQRACRGTAKHIYPYGNVLVPGRCNDHRSTHPAVEYFGTTASWIFSEIDNPCLDQLADSLDPAGANSDCVTAEGVFDMMGNLHEWTADPNGTFRGGFFVDTVKNGSGCLYVTTAHDVLHWDYSTGFRCCADP